LNIAKFLLEKYLLYNNFYLFIKKVLIPMPDTNNIIDSAAASTILKWAVTILIAGFIAQFGKKFANFLTEKVRNIRKKKAEKIGGKQGAEDDAEVPSERPDPAGIHESVDVRARLKLEKKKAKAAAKEQKKKS
jgi:hypothetical protein